MKTKHSKGEWIIQTVTTADKLNLLHTDCVLLDSNYTYVKPAVAFGENKEQAMANAKLISAAPDLLENLIRCVDRLEENGYGDMFAVTRAKEAIKKATEL